MGKILIIDDDQALRKTLSDILRVKGHEPVTAGNGAEGFALLEGNGVDVVLLDLQLPDVSGLDVLGRVKSKCPHAEVIVLTGHAAVDSAIEAANRGAFSYLQKPYDMDQLLLTIMRAIEKRKAAESLRESEERYRGIVDNIGIGVALIGPGMEVLSLNKWMKANFPDVDASERPVCYRAFKQPQREDACPGCPVSKTLADGTVSESVMEIHAPDGVMDVRVVSSPVKDGEGKVVAAIEMMEDITERRRAEEKLHNEVAVTGALLEASKVTSGNLVWEDVAGEVAELLHKLAGCSSVLVLMLVSDGMLLPQKAAGLSEDDLPYFYSLRVRAADIGCFKEALSSRKTLLIDRHGSAGAFDERCHKALQIQEAAVAPISVRDNIFGFVVANFERLPSDGRVINIIDGIAGQLGVAYENTRLYEETQSKSIELARSLETLKVLSEIDRRILSSLDKDEIMENALSQIRRVAPADIAGVWLLQEETGCVQFCYGWSLNLKKGDAVSREDCPGCRALDTGVTLVRKNLAEERNLSALDRALLEGGIKSDLFVPIICKGKGVGLLHVGSYRVAGFLLNDIRPIENLANQLGIALDNAKLVSDLEEMFINIISVLSSTIEAKSPWTRGHSERVTKYALRIGEGIGLSQGELDRLRLASLLHDIGKIATLNGILDKSEGLTDEEFAKVKRHPAAGADILRPIKQFKDIIPIVHHHHERWDGAGYPDGLKGEEIPLLARILCVADSFDSMTNDRPYRKSPGIDFSLKEFRRCAGTQFDPKLVEVFIGILMKMKNAA